MKTKAINFDELYQKYNDRKWLLTDPIQQIYSYQNPKDQELVGFIVSLFSYGSVPQILKALQIIFKPMGDSPYQFIKETELIMGEVYPNFYYRFHKEKHLIVLFKTIQKIIKKDGSLQAFYRKNYIDNIYNMLANTAEYFWSEFESFNEDQDPQFKTAMKFLINSPKNQSACKRHLMFLRWMVRSDQIDLGLWNWIQPSELIVPLDTHMVQKSYELGLRKGPKKRSVTWKLALEVTNALRKINSADPIKYDFSITRLGIIKNKEKLTARSN